MKGNMLTFAQLCLLLCWMLPVCSKKIHLNLTPRGNNEGIPLSMVEDSVDDMYFGCNEAMMKEVKYKYLENEKRMYAWDNAKDCTEKKFKERYDKALTKDHIQAICVYTSNNLYENFNKAVRTERSIYRSSFPYHSLHYLLTSAIQILNNKNSCHITYRRSRNKFTGRVNQIIRFGTFASSSFRTDLTGFGQETCFKIKTCSGAFLKDYSFYDQEAEVLIPPYEMFKITKEIHLPVKIKGLGDCKVVFVLKSAGGRSNLNCKAVHQVQKFFSNKLEKNNLPFLNFLTRLSQLNQLDEQQHS
ncbi:erythroblast NAD(P)(+)--arginine ADP-ribosyltransferase-like isoform X1 [Anoplopoma fimbria]|uniref:erythroblast NAD(P)(+)--arginine ADP-ribosyltransferase-like isoform X1 n=1 Tax=Anoplopoma fimbria TaxID=229290 RepID=UPI0023EC1B83|nr:erythroblast NAD(P)(+)--arginine ADP-ribosyltransferase-like isoform X1 [Anoplopoma fimbria]